jgi:DNA-binding transcriptional MerR regulator
MDATKTTEGGLRVAELAVVGVGADIIRFYEKTGLLLAPARTPAGYRLSLEASAVDRLPEWCSSCG